jgi:hypothetical protein
METFASCFCCYFLRDTKLSFGEMRCSLISEHIVVRLGYWSCHLSSLPHISRTQTNSPPNPLSQPAHLTIDWTNTGTVALISNFAKVVVVS